MTTVATYTLDELVRQLEDVVHRSVDARVPLRTVAVEHARGRALELVDGMREVLETLVRVEELRSDDPVKAHRRRGRGLRRRPVELNDRQPHRRCLPPVAWVLTRWRSPTWASAAHTAARTAGK